MAFFDPSTSKYDYSKTISEARARLKSLKLDEKVFMNNNVAYVEGLEYQGKSKKAPNGMLRKNIARIDAILSKAVTKTKAQIGG